MATSRTTKILYWITTAIIFIFEGLIPAFTSHTQLAVDGVRHLGYPDYFRVMLTVFKVLGALVLILPFFRGAIKEWAYAGFTFTMIAAAVSHGAVDGVDGQSFFPLIVLAILLCSYYFYKRIQKAE